MDFGISDIVAKIRGSLFHSSAEGRWPEYFESISIEPSALHRKLVEVLSSNLTWVVIYDNEIVTVQEFDALSKAPKSHQVLGLGLVTLEGKKLCLCRELWKLVGGDESCVQEAFFWNIKGGPLNVYRRSGLGGRKAKPDVPAHEFSIRILAACGHCDSTSYCFPERSPRIQAVRTADLPNDVKFYDFNERLIRLTDFHVVEHNLDPEKEWHVGRVTDLSLEITWLRIGDYVAICIWYQYYFSEETKSAAAGLF